MVKIFSIPFFLPLLPNIYLLTADADGNESAASISRALGMFQDGWRQQVDAISDYVIENMQEIVSRMSEAKRRLTPIPNVRIDNREH
jgi:hypothetical protein